MGQGRHSVFREAVVLLRPLTLKDGTRLPTEHQTGALHGPLATRQHPQAGYRGMFLRVSREIERVKRHGQRVSTQFFNLLFIRNSDSPSQVGIVVGRRFGIAVRRNRAKRIFRELVRDTYKDLVPGSALLVFPKRDALVEPFEDLKTAWLGTLRKQRLLAPKTL